MSSSGINNNSPREDRMDIDQNQPSRGVKRGRDDESFEAMRIQNNIGRSYLTFMNSQVRGFSGLPEEARRAFMQAKALNPNSPDIIDAEQWFKDFLNGNRK